MPEGPNPTDDTLRILESAVKASPDNAALRRHLADLLVSAGRRDDAVDHYREVLRLTPDDATARLALARCYFESNRDSHAIVVLESLLAKGEAPPAAHALMAKLAFRAGDSAKASFHYKEAIEADPTLRDAALEQELIADPAAGAQAMTHDGDAGDASDDAIAIERPKIDFSHVGGMENVKAEIEIKVIQPLLKPELFKAYGKKIGGGILLYGPPGCGKTHLARATAGQVHAAFFAVGLSDVLDMWIGNSEKQLHAIFEQARANRPFVLFFDEVDAIAANRSDLRHSGGRTLVNQFLEELDGARGDNDGLLVLAATNAPWHLDPAFRRPGRFDRILFVPPPDESARATILEVLLRDKPKEAIDHGKIAKATDQFSGADLRGLVELATEEKLREAMKSGSVKPLSTKDLLAAVKLVKPSTKEWFATARNYVLYANQGGQYDDVKKYLGIG